MAKRLLRNRGLQVTGALLVGAVCLWLSLRQVRGDAFLAQLTSFSVPLVAAAIACVVLVAAGKALRWQWLSGDTQPRVTWPTHFGILMISQMLNLVIPIRIGELARLGLMRQEDRPVGVTFGTIVVEKTFDLLAMGLIVLATIPLALIPVAMRAKASVAGLLLGVVLFVLLLALGRLERPIVGMLGRIRAPRHARLSRALNWVRRAVAAALGSMAGLRGRQLARVSVVTAAVWLLSLVTIKIMLAAFGLELGWGAALAVMLALTSSNWAPTPPAMIGVVGAVTMAVLGGFGIDASLGLALGTVLNVDLVGPPVLLGGIALWLRLWRLGETLSASSLRRAAGLHRQGDEVEVVRPAGEGGHGQA